MRKHITAVAAVAGSLLLAPVLMNQANAGGHGGMGGGMGHMGGGMMDHGAMCHGMKGHGMIGRGMCERIMFALMDTDGDGTLSVEEFQTAHAKIFKAIDANKDGKVTPEEMEMFFRGGSPTSD